MTGRRISSAIAAVGILLSFIGAWRVLSALERNSSGAPPFFELWAIFPVVLSLLGLWAVRTRSAAFVWGTVGAICGFVVIGGFSIGPFYGWQALAMLGAGCVFLDSIHPRWKLLAIPLWFVTGALALCPLLLVVGVLEGANVSSSPVVVFGTWMLVAILGGFAASYALAGLWRRRRSTGSS